jgi:deoxycytidylate deaminase
LFGQKDGTVAVTTLNDKDIYGVNSNSPTYTSTDRQAAEQIRDVLVQKYPETMTTDNLGQRPNDALFHAEATALLRAAAENGGSLSGRRFEIYVDNAMCASCRAVLPKIGLELGNPTVTFVDTAGFKQTIRNGVWERW